MFDIVKRDGRREEYDRTKLARSLTRAGVAPYMLAGILDIITPNPGQDTRSLRADVESELERWQPSAARRYAFTRSLAAHGSEQAGYGWVCLNPETASRLGLRPGDTVWLSHDGTPAPFSIEGLEDVERGHAWLNPGRWRRWESAMERGWPHPVSIMRHHFQTREAGRPVLRLRPASPNSTPIRCRETQTGGGTMCNTRLAVAVFVLLAAGTLLATPPDRIKLSYSDSTSTLTIAAHHPTFYAAAHHVATISVKLNDSLVTVQRFSSQTNNQEQDTQCRVPGAKPGDRLIVTAVCSLFGMRTETLILPAPEP